MDAMYLTWTTGRWRKFAVAELALIPQNAGQSLTPTSRVGQQINESVKLHTELAREQRRVRTIELLSQVRLPEPEELLERYPHELSGGQQQRIAIAMALAGEPDVLLLDEPTTGLDVTTQVHILELLRELAAETGTAMVYVSHDLGAIARVSDRVSVMYAGELVLEGRARQVLKKPAHPYARGLLLSIPRVKEAVVPASMPGRPPPPGGAGQRCAFADRCPMAEQRCRDERPASNPPQSEKWSAAISTNELSSSLHRSHRNGQTGHGWTKRTASFDSTTWQSATPTECG